MGPVSSTVVILFLVTSVFAVVSVHLFGQQNAANFGNNELYYIILYVNIYIYIYIRVTMNYIERCQLRFEMMQTNVNHC